jgi:hypothetical protein
MRYFIGFLVTIGLIILLIVLIFNGGSSSKATVTPKPLTSYYNTDAQVQLTIDGPITAVQDHEQVQISVNNGQTTYSQISGYNGEVVNTESYSNTQNSFYSFLRALETVSFTSGDTSSKLSNERGLCPLGRRYVVQLTQDGKTIERFWSTSCGGTKTYNGNLPVTIELFEAQVPDYSTLTDSVTL